MTADWTDVKMLVPLAREHLEDLLDTGVELDHTMVMALESDIPSIKAALQDKKTLKCEGKTRPKIEAVEPYYKRVRHDIATASSSNQFVIATDEETASTEGDS